MKELRLEGPRALDQTNGRALYDRLREEVGRSPAAVVLDLSGTESMDTRGAAWIIAMAGLMRENKGQMRVEGQTGKAAEFVELIEPSLGDAPKIAEKDEGFLVEIGGQAIKWAWEVKDSISLIIDALYWTVVGPLAGEKFRWGLWVEEVFEMGVRAVRINCLMNFLLGLIIAMLSAAQIAKFGLGIYVADAIMIGFARELAAIMTAVVVSARTGAAIAAEISTMRVQEELDALRGMGLNVAQFLVAPKMLALIVVMPCLVALGMVSGILGGALWGILVIGIRPDAWFHETLQAATLPDIFQGMLKAFCFAVMIVLVGCHNGFRVSGGSRGVGLMTTRAVVMDIFFIIIIDIIFAAIFYYVLETNTI